MQRRNWSHIQPNVYRADAYQTLEEYVNQFVLLSPHEWDTVRGCFRPFTARKNEMLVQVGDIVDSVYFINQGTLRTFYLEGGKDITRHFFFEGRFACALTSFLTREPSVEGMEALEACELLRISYDDMERLYGQISKWQELGRKVMEGAYLISTQRIESLLCVDATRRYQNLVNFYPDLLERVPSYHIASYLGIEPETLSRIRRKLAQQTIS